MKIRGPIPRSYGSIDEELADVFAREWDRRSGLPAQERLPAVIRVIREALASTDDIGLLRAIAPDPPSRPSLSRVQTALGMRGLVARIAEAAGLALSDLLGVSRIEPVARVRQEAAWVLRNVRGLSFPIIGLALGGRDHTTILMACRAVDARIEGDSALRDQLLAFADEPAVRAA